mmetsp:Transcript_14346/g.39628  ORF Transcript_14346/g.39628 Transcript_14346/m.39628 type:complete len:316 (-) Transcript_14346:248-1195(-)
MSRPNASAAFRYAGPTSTPRRKTLHRSGAGPATATPTAGRHIRANQSRQDAARPRQVARRRPRRRGRTRHKARRPIHRHRPKTGGWHPSQVAPSTAEAEAQAEVVLPPRPPQSLGGHSLSGGRHGRQSRNPTRGRLAQRRRRQQPQAAGAVAAAALPPPAAALAPLPMVRPARRALAATLDSGRSRGRSRNHNKKRLTALHVLRRSARRGAILRRQPTTALLGADLQGSGEATDLMVGSGRVRRAGRQGRAAGSVRRSRSPVGAMANRARPARVRLLRVARTRRHRLAHKPRLGQRVAGAEAAARQALPTAKRRP